MEQNLITPAGLTRLSEELERLKTVARAELSTRMRDAYTSETEPTENVAYQEIQAEQALLEARIVRLEQRLADAEIAEPNPRNGIADLGERVRVRDVDTDEEAEYELVGMTEADPGAGRISVESPVGRALLGCRRGDVAVADTPQRKRRLEVLSIRQPRRSA